MLWASRESSSSVKPQRGKAKVGGYCSANSAQPLAFSAVHAGFLTAENAESTFVQE